MEDDSPFRRETPLQLKPCPFCGEAMRIRHSVNPYGECPTERCAGSRQVVALDDPRQVAAWNRRASDDLIEAIFVAGFDLVETLGKMIPAMDNCVVVSANHGVPYHGPSMGADLRRMRDALHAYSAAKQAAAVADTRQLRSERLGASEPQENQ